MSETDPSKAKFDVYRTITDKIVQAIEAGAGEFVMPWHSRGAVTGRPTNAATMMRYQGVNVVALWAEAMVSGYTSGTWGTFRQWQKLRARVRKGEHGTIIVFYKKVEAGEASEDAEDAKGGARLIARASWVFNAEQVDGWERPAVTPVEPAVVLDSVEAFVAATQAVIRHDGDIACYRPLDDIILMPDRTRFVGSPTSSPTHAYYSTLLHELTHWSGATHRLNRTFGERFKDNAYAFEELVAELGAAFLCGDLGISNEPRQDHAAYVASWLLVLQQDCQAVFRAARLASAAALYLNDFT